MKGILFAGAAAAALISFLLASRADACACCADPGVWSELRSPIDSYQATLLQSLRMVGQAWITPERAAGAAGGAGGIQASDDDLNGAFRVAFASTARSWTLKLTTQSGKKGVLQLALPTKLVRFASDVKLKRRRPDPNVTLYKEWRLRGKVQASGIFSGQTYQLILRADGNDCDEADQFKRWFLQIWNPRARRSYAFHGALAPR